MQTLIINSCLPWYLFLLHVIFFLGGTSTSIFDLFLQCSEIEGESLWKYIVSTGAKDRHCNKYVLFVTESEMYKPVCTRHICKEIH